MVELDEARFPQGTIARGNALVSSRATVEDGKVGPRAKAAA